VSAVAVSFSGETTLQAKRRLAQGYKAIRNRRIAELLRLMIYTTPVKTGEARGAWRISAGAPVSAHSERLDPDGAKTYLEEVGTLESIHHFANVFVTNTAPHFQFLEQGSSQQAPQGVIRVVLPAFKSMHTDVA
jgi:hypothetical protein